jgi:hypothetical protein
MKTDAQLNPEKPTEEWVTGEEPMTARKFPISRPFAGRLAKNLTPL